jgi:hypothetical protein
MADLTPELTPGSEVPVTDLVDDPTYRTATPEEIKNTDPFDGASKTFEVDKEINLAQLQHEIEEASGATLQFSLHRIPGEVAGTLYIAPGKDIDGRKVNGKIKSHKPDPHFGLTDEQRMRAKVAEKVRAGKVLTPEELTVILQSLVDRR